MGRTIHRDYTLSDEADAEHQRLAAKYGEVLADNVAGWATRGLEPGEITLERLQAAAKELDLDNPPRDEDLPFLGWPGMTIDSSIALEATLERLEAAAKAAGIGFTFSRATGAITIDVEADDEIATYRPYCPGDEGEEDWTAPDGCSLA